MKPVLISIISMLALSFVAPAGAAPMKGWLLKQNTDYRGTLSISIGPKVGKIISRDLGAISSSKSGIVMFNLQRKSYMNFTHDEFMERFAAFVDKKHTKVETKENSVIKGLKATRYHIVVTERNGRPWYEEDLWTTRDIPMEKQFVDEYSGILEIPSIYGVPLTLVRTYADGRHVNMLKTLDCKSATFTQKDFAIDTAYKKVKDETQILTMDTGTDLSEVMDAGPPTTKRTKLSAPPATRKR